MEGCRKINKVETLSNSMELKINKHNIDLCLCCVVIE